MQTIGEKLEEARKHKGISLREAAEVTKIRGEYLASLEGDTFDINLPEIYVRGFLKNYALFLKLNAEKIITDYDVLNIGNQPFSKKNEGSDTLKNNGSKKISSSKKKSGEFFGRMDLPEQKKAFSRKRKVPAPPGEEGEEPEEEEGSFYESFDKTLYMKVGAIAGGGLFLVLLLFLLVRAIVTPGDNAVAGQQDPASSSQEIFLNAEGEILNVKVTQVDSDAVLFEGSLSTGDRQPIPYEGAALRLTVTNREHLRIERNGSSSRLPGSGPAQTTIQ